MTESARADRIAAKWAAARPKFEGAFHADTYDLYRTTRASDGRGGTTVTEVKVEAGRCQLILGNGLGRESYSADALQSRYRLSAEMPEGTIANPDDVLEVNGTRYQIVTVDTPGEHGLLPVAQLEHVE